MSTTTIAILCISALVVSIVVGSVKKVNIGILSSSLHTSSAAY